MLNLGQVVYDLTNERVLIFGGVAMYRTKDDHCEARFNFMDENLKEERYDSKSTAEGEKKKETVPFVYKNWPRDPETDKTPIGSFALDAGLMGCYFGNVDFKMVLENEEMIKSINETFKAAKTWDPPL